MTYTQSLYFDSPNSSTLTLFIDTFLRGTLAKSLSHHTYICEEAFWYLGSSSKGTKFIFFMQWAIAGSGKLEKTRFDITLLEQEAWRAQVHWIDQVWRVFCYSCIPNFFLQWIIDCLKGGEEIFRQGFRFPLR